MYNVKLIQAPNIVISTSFDSLVVWGAIFYMLIEVAAVSKLAETILCNSGFNFPKIALFQSFIAQFCLNLFSDTSRFSNIYKKNQLAALSYPYSSQEACQFHS